MTNLEISYQQAWGAVYLVIQVPYPQFLEGYRINQLQQINLDFLLPVIVSNNTAPLMYRIPEQAENIRFMDTTVTKQQAVTIMINMFGILVNLKNWSLDYHKVCMDTRGIYVNKMNGKVYYAYVPRQDYMISDPEIKQALQEIIQSFTITDDSELKGRVLGCFTDEVTLEGLFQRILKVCNSSPSQTTSEVEQKPVYYLELVQADMSGIPEKISLDFSEGEIVIGRSSQSDEQPDVAFPSECKGIGRKHAKIERKGDTYFLIDLNSVNFTYLNGQQLNPNQPYELQVGCEVTFTKTKPVRYRMVKK